jgi:hypothetical protein
MPGSSPTGACHGCLQMLSTTESCVITAATQGDCPADADCTALASCLVGC